MWELTTPFDLDIHINARHLCIPILLIPSPTLPSSEPSALKAWPPGGYTPIALCVLAYSTASNHADHPLHSRRARHLPVCVS